MVARFKRAAIRMRRRVYKPTFGRSRTHYDRTVHGHRPIIGDVYTPNVHVRRLACVEQRPAEAKRLRCNTCDYEISSSWFRVGRHGIAKMLKPRAGHSACRRASKISQFTTIDGSSSITDHLSRCRVDACDRLFDRLPDPMSIE